jgi:hypothetical protein
VIGIFYQSPYKYNDMAYGRYACITCGFFVGLDDGLEIEILNEGAKSSDNIHVINSLYS